MPYPYRKFRQNPFTSLQVIRRTDRQTETNRQTDRTKNITSFFGGGNEWMNEWMNVSDCRWTIRRQRIVLFFTVQQTTCNRLPASVRRVWTGVLWVCCTVCGHVHADRWSRCDSVCTPVSLLASLPSVVQAQRHPTGGALLSSSYQSPILIGYSTIPRHAAIMNGVLLYTV